MDTAAHQYFWYALDGFLALLLGTVVVCAGIRVVHALAHYGYHTVNGTVTLLSRLYQASMGLVVFVAIVTGLVFYFTTHEQRTAVHATLETLTPQTSKLIQHGAGNVTELAMSHLKQIARQFIES